MKFNSLEIENFRNIENLSLDFDDINIVYGENAQGKTNLLEAIYLFTGSKSFRGVKDKELIRFGTDFFKLKTEFFSSNRQQNAEIVYNNKKSVLLNGIKKNSSACLNDEVKAVIFSPVHLSMIKDGPSQRRKFVDMALCQIKSGYRNLVKEYSRCLLQRNMLLKKANSENDFEDTLFVWDNNLAKIGAKIVFQRQKYIEALMPYVKEIHQGLSSSKENISLTFSSHCTYQDKTTEEIEEELILLLKSRRKADIFQKTTSIGPHRDDLEIFINEKSARLYGSQGQQRSCVLSLKLAEASLLRQMTNKKPVALLDDVMSELDLSRQDYILNNMKDMQIFITCCDVNTVLRLKSGKTFHIENGGLI